mgnify:CR=1 FL=1
MIIKMTAFNRNESGTFNQNARIKSVNEVSSVVKNFDADCPFHKYYMETEVEYENGDPLTEEDIKWLMEYDINNDIGFLG